MADLNEFQDIEARLRKYRPAEPSAKVRATVLGKATQLPPMIPRRRLWRWVAAAVLLIALNLGTEWFMSSRTRVGAASRAQSAAAPSSLTLVETVNGFATHWGHLAVYWNGSAPRLASWWRERERLVKELSQ